MARRTKGRIPRMPDVRSFAEALSFAGIDPRTWISYATVDGGEDVAFDEDHGYLVPVTLQPSQVQCVGVCMQQTAGDSEGEHVPFVEGDTLVVALPHGMERAGVIVLGRVSNNRAKPPSMVAGQDSTKNNMAWRKQRVPHLEEYGDRYTIRQAASEALFNIDKAGIVTIRDGGKGVLQMSSDIFSYQSGDTQFSLQYDVAAARFTITNGTATFAISSLLSIADLPMSISSVLSVPGSMQIAAAGNLAGEHASSVEGTGNFLFWAFTQVLTPLITALTGLTTVMTAAVTNAPGTPLFVPGALAPTIAALAALIPGLSGFIASAATTAATTPQNPAIGTAIFGAMTAQPPKQVPAVPPQGQVMPGLGSQGLLIG